MLGAWVVIRNHGSRRVRLCGLGTRQYRHLRPVQSRARRRGSARSMVPTSSEPSAAHSDFRRALRPDNSPPGARLLGVCLAMTAFDLFNAIAPQVADEMEREFNRQDLCILTTRVVLDVCAYFGCPLERSRFAFCSTTPSMPNCGKPVITSPAGCRRTPGALAWDGG